MVAIQQRGLGLAGVGFGILIGLMAVGVIGSPAKATEGSGAAAAMPAGPEQEVGAFVKARVLEELHRLELTMSVAIDVWADVGPERDGHRSVALTWLVRDMRGRNLCTAIQRNVLPAELFWRVDPVWEDAAVGAAGGIAKCVRFYTQGDDA